MTLRRATTRITKAATAVKSVANASAPAMLIRSPSCDMSATWTAPARPASTESPTARPLPDTVSTITGERLRDGLCGRRVALPEMEGDSLRVAARGEPAVRGDRRLVFGLPAELAHLRDRGVDVVDVEIHVRVALCLAASEDRRA